MQTDGQTDMIKLIVVPRHVSHMPKKCVRPFYNNGETLTHFTFNTQCSVPRMNDVIFASL